MTEEVKKEQETYEELKLPRVEAPLYNFNKDTKMFWIGLPLDKMDTVSTMLMLDSMKFEAAKIIQALLLMKASAENKIIKPGSSAFQKMKNFLVKTKKV